MFSVSWICYATMELRATAMEGSMAQEYCKRVPTICWMHLMLAGDRGEDMLTGAVCLLVPYLMDSCWWGACCGCGRYTLVWTDPLVYSSNPTWVTPHKKASQPSWWFHNNWRVCQRGIEHFVFHVFKTKITHNQDKGDWLPDMLPEPRGELALVTLFK